LDEKIPEQLFEWHGGSNVIEGIGSIELVVLGVLHHSGWEVVEGTQVGHLIGLLVNLLGVGGT
jgi:hypothetical protein